jgi:hypothetical protein
MPPALSASKFTLPPDRLAPHYRAVNLLES